MRNIVLSMLCAVASLISINAYAQFERTISPTAKGATVTCAYRDASGKLKATYDMKIRSSQGNMENGKIEMVYTCFDANGKPFFDAPNEFVMAVSRVDNQTYTLMDQVFKMTKIEDLLPVGDASTIPLTMTVGEKLPDSVIYVRVAKIKVAVTITDKLVKDHKSITTPAGTFDCYLVHEKVTTKTSFGTKVETADTWYSEGVGSVKQTIYNSKGQLKATQELTAVSH